MLFTKRVNDLISIGIFFIVILISQVINYDNNLTTYVFDSKYSIFVQNIDEVNYTPIKEKQTSKFTNIIFAKIMKPVFIIETNNEKKYLSRNCVLIEKVNYKDVDNLVKLDCSDNYGLVPEVYSKFNGFSLKSLKLIDNRRWQAVIIKNNKTITLDFPSGIPDVEYFKRLDEKYDLTNKYSVIDLRFPSKIGIE